MTRREKFKQFCKRTSAVLGIKRTFKRKNKDGSVLVERYNSDGLLESKTVSKKGQQILLERYTYSIGGRLLRKDIENEQNKDLHEEYDYHPNGQLESKIAYKGLEKDGPYEIYYENGQLQDKGSFKDGKRDSLWEAYHENGQLEKKGTLKDGKVVGPYEAYHENGQLWKKGSYKDGKQDGLWESYYGNGQLATKCTFKNGKQDGPWESYYENGQLKEKSVFRNGEELTGQEAEEYLSLFLEQEAKQKNEKALVGLKKQLAQVEDLESTKRSIKPARTSERTDTAARITRVRRARDILAKAAQKAQAEGNDALVNEIIEIAKPYMARQDALFDNFHDRQALRRSKAKGK